MSTRAAAKEAGIDRPVGHDRRRLRRTTTWAAAFSLVAVSACGAAAPVRAITTANAVSDSFSNLRAQPGVTVSISLGVTSDQLLQMQKVDNGGGLTKALASSLIGTSVVFDVHTGHGESLAAAKTSADKDGQVELSLLVKGTTPIDVRVVNQTVFVNADLAKLLTLYGQDPTQAAAAQAGLSQMEATIPGISKLGAGGWVSVSMQQLETLAPTASKSGARQRRPRLAVRS